MSRLILVCTLLNPMIPAHSEFYLDVGVVDVAAICVVTEATLTTPFGVQHARAESTLKVDSTLPRIGVGYKYNGFHLEYEEFGGSSSDERIKSWSAYYRLEF